jgi:hypothetical protein
MEGKHSGPEVNTPAASMEHPIDTELALHDLSRSRTIQSVSAHQALDTVNLNEDFNRFFHSVSRVRLVRPYA